MPRNLAHVDSEVAIKALDMVAAGDLNARHLADLARLLDRLDDPTYPLHFARADVLGRLDAAPGDGALLLALGLLVVASNQDWKGTRDDDDHRLATRSGARRRARRIPQPTVASYHQ